MFKTLLLFVCLCSSNNSLAAIHDGASPPIIEEIEISSYIPPDKDSPPIIEEIKLPAFADLITPYDPSTFGYLFRVGTVERFDQMYWEKYTAHLHKAVFTDGYILDILVHDDVPLLQAKELAEDYAYMIGQLPPFLYSGVISLHLFTSYGHGPSGRTPEWYNAFAAARSRYIEETLVHKFTHASIDIGIPWQFKSPIDGTTIVEQITVVDRELWLEAIENDNYFMSSYAHSIPTHEDLAEVFPAYLASRWRPERFDASFIRDLNIKMRNRFQLLDTYNFNLP
jgi:hypothetical protein